MISFVDYIPNRESYWRAIILFGNNVAPYKFALAKSLLELTSEDKVTISLEELAVPFSKNICEHLKGVDRQITSPSSAWEYVKYLERLHRRNTFLIDSQHPLRETLIKQTGITELDRIAFLNEVYKTAISILIHKWEPKYEFEQAF